MRIYLQSIADGVSSPRFYQLSLQKDMLGGWTLIKESGYQGGAGRITRELFASWDDAVQTLLATRDKQLQRGYQVVFVQGQESPND